MRPRRRDGSVGGRCLSLSLSFLPHVRTPRSEKCFRRIGGASTPLSFTARVRPMSVRGSPLLRVVQLGAKLPKENHRPKGRHHRLSEECAALAQKRKSNATALQEAGEIDRSDAERDLSVVLLILSRRAKENSSEPRPPTLSWSRILPHSSRRGKPRARASRPWRECMLSPPRRTRSAAAAVVRVGTPRSRRPHELGPLSAGLRHCCMMVAKRPGLGLLDTCGGGGGGGGCIMTAEPRPGLLGCLDASDGGGEGTMLAKRHGLGFLSIDGGESTISLEKCGTTPELKSASARYVSGLDPLRNVHEGWWDSEGDLTGMVAPRGSCSLVLFQIHPVRRGSEKVAISRGSSWRLRGYSAHSPSLLLVALGSAGSCVFFL